MLAGTTINQIQQSAINIISQNPNGIRYTPLKTLLRQQFPQVPEGTIHNAIWLLPQNHSSQIYKPVQGLYAPTGPASSSTSATAVIVAPLPAVKPPSEKQFYQPFADYLKNDLEEATEAEELGGAGLGKKWGTPDIVGVYKPLASDRIKFDLEIVSAEVKIDPQESVTAFGQAIAYRLFSTKVYVVMPSTLPKEDQSRLEALCMLFGVGLVIFDLNINAPNFSTRVRAQRFAPDMFYVNVFADQLYKHNLTLFQKLF